MPKPAHCLPPRPIAGPGNDGRLIRRVGGRRHWLLSLLLCHTAYTSAFLAEYNLKLFRPARDLFIPRLCRSAAKATTEDIEEKLGSLTVKELRTLLKESGMNQKGILSRLKLKRDLVVFLRDNLDLSSLDSLIVNGEDAESTASGHNNPGVQASPLSMPLKSTEASQTLPVRTAKERAVYQQYPTLNDTCTDFEGGENDIRQKYHPVFGGEQAQLPAF